MSWNELSLRHDAPGHHAGQHWWGMLREEVLLLLAMQRSQQVGSWALNNCVQKNGRFFCLGMMFDLYDLCISSNLEHLAYFAIVSFQLGIAKIFGHPNLELLFWTCSAPEASGPPRCTCPTSMVQPIWIAGAIRMRSAATRSALKDSGRVGFRRVKKKGIDSINLRNPNSIKLWICLI